MKKSNLMLAFSLLLLAVVFTAVLSCNKTNLPPDPNDNVVVKRELVVSALDIFTKDSIGQFNVTVVSPTGTASMVTTGKTYVIKDPAAGNYKITVTKTGYADTDALSISVVVPTDPKASMSLPASILLTKLAPAVTVTGTTGAVISVKTNSTDAASTPIAAAVIAPGTVFTLPDGSKPATVAISVSNVPLSTDNATTGVIDGVVTTVIKTDPEVINGQIASQKLDLQPSGLVLSQPMTIDMYIGNDYPPSMTVAEKTARQAGLTLNYVRKDGTVEVVTPDRFSTDRNTVYYKILHFSQGGQTNKKDKFNKDKALVLVPKSAAGQCQGGIVGTIDLTYKYNKRTGWLITGQESDIAFSHVESYNVSPKAGYYPLINFTFGYDTYTLTDATAVYGSTQKILKPRRSATRVVSYVVCHN